MKPNHKNQFSIALTLILTTFLGACSSPSTQINNSTNTGNNLNPTNPPTPLTTPNITESPIPTPTPTTTPETNPSPVPTQAKQREKSDRILKTQNPTTSKATKVTLYSMDADCQDFIPEESTVQANEPVNDIVGKVLAKNENSDFDISGYRVNVKNGIATVDLRVAPESKRQIASLSSCENNSIFGSVRKTLTSNPQWNIKDVKFTEKGEEIVQ